MESNIKKIKKLDLSPHAYSFVRIGLPEDIKETIETLRLKYGYRGDLYELLITLPSWVNSYKDIQRQKGRSKKKKILLMKTMKAAETLQKYLECFSGEMRSKMKNERIKNNPYKSFVEIENNLPFLIDKCQIEAIKIPSDIGGQTGGSIPKSIIWYLIQRYEDNVESEATCGWVHDIDAHIGDFYEFLIEIKPILIQLGIKLGTNKSIGQYTRELLTYRNKMRNELTALIIVILSKKEFFAKCCPNITYYLLYHSLFNLHSLKSPRFYFI